MSADMPGVDQVRARQSASRLWSTVCVAGLVGLAIAGWWAWNTLRPVPRPRAATSEELAKAEERPLVEPPGYLGTQACAECHADRVAEFSRTNHFHTFRRAVPDSMPTGFVSGTTTLAMRDVPIRFEMSREGDRFLQTAITGRPDGDLKKTTAIDLILGAGTADDVYLSWRPDGGIYELPMAWLHTSAQWGASNFDPFGAEDYSREVNPRCIECHNTWLHHFPGTPNRYQHEHALLGVGCERCHGPAQEHVAFHREHPAAAGGEEIVRPARLSRERQHDLCTQCHSNAMRRRGPAFSYRPGEPLDEAFATLHTQHTEDDHVANQIQYLRQSKCFQQSESLTCTTCHDPHRPRPADYERVAQASCLTCHQPAQCGEQPRLPEAVRTNCTGCHMPSYVKMNVYFATHDDAYVTPMYRFEHRIAVHPAARDKVLLDWLRTQSDPDSGTEADRLTAKLVDHWLEQADSFRAAYRFSAVIGAYREALRISDTPELRERLRKAVEVQRGVDLGLARALHEIEVQHFAEAREVLEGLLAIKPDLAKAHGRLGTVLAVLGQKDLAREHLGSVTRFDPDDSYGETMLGWLAYLEGQPVAALEHYRRADEIEPWNAKIWFHIGMAQSVLNRPGEAIEAYRRVLEIDPGHAEASCKLSLALCDQGNPQSAEPIALRAVTLTGRKNLDALLTLSRAYGESGRAAEATSVIEEALALARARFPGRVGEVLHWKKRLESLATPDE